MNEKKILCIFIAGALAFSAALVCGVEALSEKRCLARWEGSGYRANYVWFTAGCMLTKKDGTRIPASAVRELP